MDDFLEQQKRQSEKDTHRAWKLIGGCLLLLLGVFVYLVFRDDALQDDSWMLPVFTSTTESQNPLRDYIKAIEKLPVAEDTLLPANVRNRLPGSEDEMNKFLSKHQGLMDAWDQLVMSDSSNWRWPISSDQKLPPSTKYLYASSKPGNTLSRMKVTILVREGRGKAAAAQALKMIKFGTGICHAEGGLEHLITSAVSIGLALSSLEEALTSFSVSEDELRHVQSELEQLEPQFLHAALSAAKCEYARVKDVLWESSSRRELSDSASGIERTALKYFLRRNRTLNAYLLSGKRLLDIKDVPGSEALHMASEQNQTFVRTPDQRWKSLINPNAGGLIALEMLAPNNEMLLRMALSTAANYRMAIVMLAIRRYEIKHGKLPATLVDLQPEFLTEIPLDPFSHKPLRWDVALKRLYSVGPDGIDNQASFNQQRDSKAADYGLFYWWGDEAKTYRESLMQDKKRPRSK